MYLLKFVSSKETVTSEKPISLEEAQTAWARWHRHNKCALVKLEIEAVNGAEPFMPDYPAYMMISPQILPPITTSHEDAPA
jgi:hypothetical protein